MADPEKNKKIEKYRKFWKGYGNDWSIVMIVVFVYALLSKHDIMDYLHLAVETSGFRNRTGGAAALACRRSASGEMADPGASPGKG